MQVLSVGFTVSLVGTLQALSDPLSIDVSVCVSVALRNFDDKYLGN